MRAVGGEEGAGGRTRCIYEPYIAGASGKEVVTYYYIPSS